jgi:hypothetical protein
MLKKLDLRYLFRVLLKKLSRLNLLPSEEEDMTIKILKRQLKEGQAVIVQLREENRKMKRRIAEHLNLCGEALEKNKRMIKISLPLHKKMKNMYRQKMTLKKRGRLKKEQIAKRNLDLLAQVVAKNFGNIHDTSCFFFCEVI